MGRIREHLQGLCFDTECQIKNALGGLFTGMVVRGNLPQTWLFIDEHGDEATFHVDSQGSVQATHGRTPDVDVLINLNHKDLENAIQSKKPPKHKYSVQCLTPKGERAFSFLKGRFGLQ
jgi:hypothetical protein